ncbi:MAG: hypothetical protein QM757_18370 [Paludibaculum sp.]
MLFQDHDPVLGLGDTASAPEGVESKPEHHDEEEGAEYELDQVGETEIDLVVTAPEGANHQHRNGDEKKAQDLIPKGMERLDDAGQEGLNELSEHY